MGLRLDYNKLINDYITNFKVELEFALEHWEQEVKSHIMSDFIKKHGNPQVNSYIKQEQNALVGFLEANPAVLADSYGTGSFMNIKDNPDYQEYRNSSLWNPARKSNKIVGRPEGTYTDIFGNTKYSSGYMKGINLEYTKTHTGFQFEPILPSNAIKDANNWLFTTYLPIAYNNTLKKMNFSKYVIEVK